MSTDPENIAEDGLNPFWVSWYIGPTRDDTVSRRRLSMVPAGPGTPRDGFSLSILEVQTLMCYLDYHPDSAPFRKDLPISFRADLLLRIAKLWRGDWRGDGAFDGRDGSQWIHLVLGTDEQLAELDQLLTETEKAYE